MTTSKIFLYFCLSFISGIFLSLFLLGFLSGSKIYFLLPVLILGIILISIFWRFKKIVVIGFCLLFLVFGIWHHQQRELKIINDELKKHNDLGKIITLIGVVDTEPDIRERHIRLIIETSEIFNQEKNIFYPFKGRVLVTTQRYPEYQYGDKLKIIGKLKTPSEDIEGFNYKNFLKKDEIYSIMSWPEISLIEKNLGSPILSTLFSFKNKFQETAQKFISPPQIGILEALFSGDESNISQEWKEKLNFTGTRHICAVSGMNITIIAFLILNFLLILGFWRQQAFYISIFLLLLYILMIGAPASAIRAGIMGGILMTAQHFGRLSAASRAVVFAAALMLFNNPLLLKFDIGFQLSFLAVFGLIYLQPIFFQWLKKIPNFKIFPIRTTLSTTLAAQVFTLPILIYNFGYISLVSPITNILIVPFLAPITILIFIFGIAGIIFWFFGWILSWPVWLALTYITKIIDFFSQIPWVFLKIENIHWIWLIISYLILGLITWRLQEKEKLKFLNY